MRNKIVFLIITSVLLLAGCGPMIGGMMVSGNGVKEFRVVKGSLEEIRPGARLAVLGPFATTESSFEICRGEEAALFASSFNQTGLFAAELAMQDRLVETPPQLANWRNKDPLSVQMALQLSEAPEILMSATILYREMIPAPVKGIVMKVAYRLNFLELGTGKETSVEISSQQMFRDAVPASVEALAQHFGRR